MEKQIEVLGLIQQNFIKLTDALTVEQLNKIPEGFGNNIVWNFAHIIASLQMLCYVRSGLPATIDETFVHAYKNGSKPEAYVSIEQFEIYNGYADQALIKIKEDYASGVFNQFKPFATATGFQISNIETGLQYVVMHHGLHLGYAMALKKIVTQ